MDIIVPNDQTTPGEQVAPSELDRLTSIKARLSVIAFVCVVASLFFAKDFILPITLGVLIALTLSPVVRALNRFGFPGAVSAFVVILGLGASLASIAYVMSGPVTVWVEGAPEMGRQLESKLKGLSDTMDAVQDASSQVDELAETSKNSDVQKVAIAQPGLLTSAVSTLSNIFTSALVALFLALFILATNTLFYEKLIGSFQKFSDKKKALNAIYDVERKVSRYLFTIAMINALLGVSVGLALYALGMPDAFIWGVVAFLLNFIPYVGMFFGVVLVGAFSIIAFDTISYALLAPAAYFALNALEGQVITPLTVGRALEMNIVAVFVTVVFWGWLWGIAGALMAVPILVLMKVVCDHVDSLETLGRFIGSRDV